MDATGYSQPVILELLSGIADATHVSSDSFCAAATRQGPLHQALARWARTHRKDLAGTDDSAVLATALWSWAFGGQPVVDAQFFVQRITAAGLLEADKPATPVASAARASGGGIGAALSPSAAAATSAGGRAVGVECVVRADFTAEGSTELTVRAGDRVVVASDAWLQQDDLVTDPSTGATRLLNDGWIFATLLRPAGAGGLKSPGSVSGRHKRSASGRRHRASSGGGGADGAAAAGASPRSVSMSMAGDASAVQPLGLAGADGTGDASAAAPASGYVPKTYLKARGVVPMVASSGSTRSLLSPTAAGKASATAAAAASAQPVARALSPLPSTAAPAASTATAVVSGSPVHTPLDDLLATLQAKHTRTGVGISTATTAGAAELPSLAIAPPPALSRSGRAGGGSPAPSHAVSTLHHELSPAAAASPSGGRLLAASDFAASVAVGAGWSSSSSVSSLSAPATPGIAAIRAAVVSATSAARALTTSHFGGVSAVASSGLVPGLSQSLRTSSGSIDASAGAGGRSLSSPPRATASSSSRGPTAAGGVGDGDDGSSSAHLYYYAQPASVPPAAAAIAAGYTTAVGHHPSAGAPFSLGPLPAATHLQAYSGTQYMTAAASLSPRQHVASRSASVPSALSRPATGSPAGAAASAAPQQQQQQAYVYRHPELAMIDRYLSNTSGAGIGTVAPAGSGPAPVSRSPRSMSTGSGGGRFASGVAAGSAPTSYSITAVVSSLASPRSAVAAAMLTDEQRGRLEQAAATATATSSYGLHPLIASHRSASVGAGVGAGRAATSAAVSPRRSGTAADGFSASSSSRGGLLQYMQHQPQPPQQMQPAAAPSVDVVAPAPAASAATAYVPAQALVPDHQLQPAPTPAAAAPALADTAAPASTGHTMVTALYAFTATGPGEMSVPQGQLLLLAADQSASPAGWSLVLHPLTGGVGYVPSSYIQERRTQPAAQPPTATSASTETVGASAGTTGAFGRSSSMPPTTVAAEAPAYATVGVPQQRRAPPVPHASLSYGAAPLAGGVPTGISSALPPASAAYGAPAVRGRALVRGVAPMTAAVPGAPTITASTARGPYDASFSSSNMALALQYPSYASTSTGTPVAYGYGGYPPAYHPTAAAAPLQLTTSVTLVPASRGGVPADAASASRADGTGVPALSSLSSAPVSVERMADYALRYGLQSSRHVPTSSFSTTIANAASAAGRFEEETQAARTARMTGAVAATAAAQHRSSSVSSILRSRFALQPASSAVEATAARATVGYPGGLTVGGGVVAGFDAAAFDTRHRSASTGRMPSRVAQGSTVQRLAF